MTRVLLLFVDGVGLGADDATINPFLNADLPTMTGLLGGAPIVASSAPCSGPNATLVGVDATFGVAGTPQSGTGQAALLTGEDAVMLHGRHFGPWVPARLRALVREQNVLVRAAREGHRIAFANAYPEEVLEQVEADGVVTLPPDDPGRAADSRTESPARAADSRTGFPAGADSRTASPHAGRRGRTPPFLRAGPPLAALGAGVLTRHTAELAAGHAVASEITNEGWRQHLGRTSLPRVDAASAGRNLAAIAAQHRLTLFAHYATDYAGHRADMAEAVRALELVDAFLGGIIGALSQDTLTLVVSDHGNIEDVRAGHTRNPALGLVIGRGHARVAKRLTSLTDVAPAILEVLTP